MNMYVVVIVPVVIVWLIDWVAGVALLAGLACIVCERDIGRAVLGGLIGLAAAVFRLFTL